VFQNKNVMCQYRAVGHPIATAVTEGLVDLAVGKIGMDPLEIRRPQPHCRRRLSGLRTVGIKFEKLSHHESLAHLDAMMNYAGLRAEQARLRQQGTHRGIGFCELRRGNQSVGGVLRRRRRTHLLAGLAPRSGSIRPARCSATRASPSRARARKPSWRNAWRARSACRSSACA
jgi:CO/xanthine dehydrogenase Mo-binding subunit